MHALRMAGPRQLVVDHAAPSPTPGPQDAVVRVWYSSLCGTDLHALRDELPGFCWGGISGHEAVGEVVAVGAEVKRRHPGDVVVVSDVVACGQCRACERGYHYQCDRVGLFGYGTVVGDIAYDGTHAEFMRVPFADTVLVPLPEGIDPRVGLLAADALSTAYQAVKAAGVVEGHSCAVVGAGPVGLLSASVARALGAARVVVIDPILRRREVAAREVADVAWHPDEAADNGEVFDACIEAVGSNTALLQCCMLAGPHSVVSVVGSNPSEASPVPATRLFAQEATLRWVVGNPILAAGRALRLMAQAATAPTFVFDSSCELVRTPQLLPAFDAGELVKILIHNAPDGGRQ